MYDNKGFVNKLPDINNYFYISLSNLLNISTGLDARIGNQSNVLNKK